MNQARYGFVLLAAGNSSRMGQPKALLPYDDTTLIGYVLRQMQALHWPLVVVVGGHAKELQPELASVISIYNKDWATGMASSIRCGLTALLKNAPVDGVMFASCDQPAVSTDLFHAIADAKESSGKGIVASGYAQTTGIPAMFDKQYFTALLQLSGEKGAKSLIAQHASDVASIDFPLGEIDIDSPEDYAKWQSLRLRK